MWVCGVLGFDILIVNTYQDTHPSFAYQPSSSWTSPPLLGTFLGSTGQYVIFYYLSEGSSHGRLSARPKIPLQQQVSLLRWGQTNWASHRAHADANCCRVNSNFRSHLRRNFSQYHPGNAIGLYGPVGPSNTQAYSVQVDDGPPSNFSAKKTFYRPQQLLFYAGNLSTGTHKISVQTKSSAGYLSIDYANVYSAPSLGGR